MTEKDVIRLAYVFSIQAEIEGMKACNKDRELNGASMAYDDAAFNECAERLCDLATKNDWEL